MFCSAQIILPAASFSRRGMPRVQVGVSCTCKGDMRVLRWDPRCHIDGTFAPRHTYGPLSILGEQINTPVQARDD